MNTKFVEFIHVLDDGSVYPLPLQKIVGKMDEALEAGYAPRVFILTWDATFDLDKTMKYLPRPAIYLLTQLFVVGPSQWCCLKDRIHGDPSTAALPYDWDTLHDMLDEAVKV